jgi:hypothetical protein
MEAEAVLAIIVGILSPMFSSRQYEDLRYQNVIILPADINRDAGIV